MAVKYERIVKEDLNRGVGTVDVTMPGGGTQVGHQIGMHSLPHVGFVALGSGSQSITGGAGATLIAAATESWDIADWWDTISSRFVPTVEGYYAVSVYALLAAFTGTATLRIAVNGVEVSSVDAVRTAAAARMFVSALVFLDGIDDYVEFSLEHNDGSNGRVVTAARLSGFVVGGSV
jgi:hypothetical protein